MKYLLALALIIIINAGGCAQPNTRTKIEFGIVNPQPDKIYRVFAEIRSDTLSSRLYTDMDYLDPDVSDLMITLNNYVIIGDTLFGEHTFIDKEYNQYLKAGLVQVNTTNLKYSAMVVTEWLDLDRIEPKPAGFIIRKKK